MPCDEGRVTDGLAVGKDAGIMTVTIDRPARRNAITQAMWDALAGLFEAVDTNSPVRVVVITGANDTAGADISEFDTMRRTRLPSPRTAMRAPSRRSAIASADHRRDTRHLLRRRFRPPATSGSQARRPVLGARREARPHIRRTP